MNGKTVISLREFEPTLLEERRLTEELAERLWREYPNQLEIDFPSPKTGGRWQIRPKGWVGHVPVFEDLVFELQPKVPVVNIFRMLEYAYSMEGFHFLRGDMRHESLEDVYERLANVLARRVLTRARKGLYRAYVACSDRLAFVRERLDVPQHLRHPWRVQPYCHYHLHTADIEANQILAWTLRTVLRTDIRREKVRAAVRQALHVLQGSVRLHPFTGQDCVGRRYTRLDEDYQPMHALCRFFLDHTGPSLNRGDNSMLPFLVDMAQLYESFVASWLASHPIEGLQLSKHDRIAFTKATYFDIDLVLYEALPRGGYGPARFVLDTKYKDVTQPATSDIQQVVAYAVATDCREAVLVYPRQPSHDFDEMIGDIRVRSLTFAIDGDLERAGENFVAQLVRGKT